MAVTHSTAARNAAANAVVDLLDTGTGTTEGKLVFLTAASGTVATLDFANPAFGAASSGIATAGTIVSDTSAAGGLTTKFEARDRDGNMVFTGSVEISGGDINLSNTTVGAGDTVEVTSLTYAAPV